MNRIRHLLEQRRSRRNARKREYAFRAAIGQLPDHTLRDIGYRRGKPLGPFDTE